MTMTQERSQEREAWDAIAAGYDQHVTPSHLWLGNQTLTRAGLRPGMRFLDVACGSGALSIPAARLGAEVTATDLSPAMVERLAARARQEGLSGLEALVMDGHELELEDASFDVAGSQFGVMLFPDLPRGLREMVRVTRPGGKVVLSVFGPPGEVEFLGFFIRAMQAVVTGFEGLPADPPPLPFQVADPARLRQQLTDAGLRDIRIETVTEELSFASATEMWDWLVSSNPIAVMLVHDLTDEQRASVIEALDGQLRERSGGSGPAVLTNPIHIAVGTR
jgi:ubiquinone/menaquinone biosynthesis C-methylase UbiE